MYEQMLLERLKQEYAQKLPLHENQRGFVPGKSTTHKPQTPVEDGLNNLRNIEY